MAGYDDVDAERNRIDPQRLEIVQNEYRLSREAREFGVVVSLGPIADVDISQIAVIGAIRLSASMMSGRPMSPA